jgi:cytoskeleton protein RodZ
MDPQSIGQRLRTAREARRATVYDAARDTRIRVDFLESMEHDSFRFVSGGTYVKGMLRQYAAWLGLDPGQIVGEYDRLYGAGVSGPSLSEIFKPPAQAPPRSRQKMWGLAAVIAASLLLVLSLVGILNPPRNRIATAPRPTPEATPRKSPEPPKLAQAPPAFQGVNLAVRVTGTRCWLHVLADGNEKAVFEGTLTNGQMQTFQASQVLRVNFGKISAVQVSVNGVDIPTPTDIGEIGTFLFFADTRSFQRA